MAEGDVFDPAMFVLLIELVRVENLPHVVSRQSRGDVRNVQNVRRVSAFTSYSRLRLFVKISRNFSTMIAVVFRRRRLDDGRPTRVVQSHLLLYKLSLSMMISPSVTTLTDLIQDFSTMEEEEEALKKQREMTTVNNVKKQQPTRVVTTGVAQTPNNNNNNTQQQQTRNQEPGSIAQPDSNTFKNHYQDLVMLYRTLHERAKGPKTLKKSFLVRNLRYIKPKKRKRKSTTTEMSAETTEKKIKSNERSRSRGDDDDESDKDENEEEEEEESEDEKQPKDDQDVMFRYFYKAKGIADLRVSEKTERAYRARCPFCNLKPRNFIGLCQHLNASHDQFYFTFLPVNTVQKRTLVDPNRMYVAKSEDRVVTMNTIEVRIKKTSFVMCENGQDKLNMLDATLLKDPANKSFEFFSGGKYQKVGTNKVILPAIGNLAPTNTSSQDVQSKTHGWENELAILKIKLNEEIRNKQLQKQNEMQLKSIEENISQVAKKAALKEKEHKRGWEENPFAQFFTPHYYDQISLDKAAAVLNGENAEEHVKDFYNSQKRMFGNDINLTKVVRAAKERVQAENRATAELGQFHVGAPEQQQRLLQQWSHSNNVKLQGVGVKRNREEGGDGREEEFPLGYAASEQLIRQRLAKEAEQKYIEKRIKKEKSKLEKRKFASQGELDKAASQKKNFRQSAQYQEVVATKKTTIQETGSRKSFAIGGRYYHSRTCLPMSKKIFKTEDKSTIPDSDDDEREQEEMWDKEDALFIDEYVDVAQVEKDFFRMWNKHVRKYCAMANRQMPDCTSSFMYVHKEKLVKDRQMRKLFHLHLMNMYDFGVLSGKVIQALVAKMNELRRESENHAPNSKLLSEKEEDTQSAEKAPPAVVEAIEIKN